MLIPPMFSIAILPYPTHFAIKWMKLSVICLKKGAGTKSSFAFRPSPSLQINIADLRHPSACSFQSSSMKDD
ncbi:hypothetical protein D920_02645 [Enterococcus faecalis 13-SD-W-01]|nr:hypothetical protein D920_02645 [Enterococcus faecalis 13-SD-W-01]